jgi:antitoxin component YwqK of YwqJK toxin-antitoxin module
VNSLKKSFVWTTAAITAAVLASLILWRLLPRPPQALRQVPSNELVLRDGRSFCQQETAPFKGAIIERYPDGSLKSRSVLSNGLMHGVSEGWYTNGNLQVREHFDKGVSHGMRTKWLADGRKMSEATIENGKIIGTFPRWHENGSLAEEIQMKDGNPDGVSIAYHPDGSLKTRATVQNGKIIEQRFWKAGECREAQKERGRTEKHSAL